MLPVIFTSWWRNCVWALIQIYGDTEGQNRERYVNKFVFSTADSVMDLLTGSTAWPLIVTTLDAAEVMDSDWYTPRGSLQFTEY